MVGGAVRRDDGLPSISSTNIFSALESRRRKSSKKRSDKDKSDSKSKTLQFEKPAPPAVWTPAPVSVTSWADCEEDDDDFFALPALPPIADPHAPTAQTDSRDDLSQDESEGEDEIDEEADEENEEQEAEATDEAVNVKTPQAPVVTPTSREPDRQLSKKELKKKELAELDAVLAEFGLNPKDEKDSVEGDKEVDENGVEPSQSENLGSGSSVAENKSTKRRKAKKDKLVKEQKEDDNGPGVDAVLKEDAEASGENTETDSTPVDRKEVLKKIASMKKKKSFKESDSAAKAAAAEAAARAARLAAAKKKEKNHYNQQPVR